MLILVGAKVIYKDRLAILEGSCTVDANDQQSFQEGSFKQTLKQVNFPNGFTKDNCVVVSFGTKAKSRKGYSYCYGGATVGSSLNYLLGNIPRDIVLGSNQDNSKINLYFYQLPTQSLELDYKIVLMRTD